MNYYNEHDPKAAAWLRELISRGLIPAGIVDERSIVDLRADELREYTQCHFFAGIGGWSYALQLAGIPATTQLWTGSCPCQPFSTAGKGLAQADERHLWPVFFDLIRQCRPQHVFGEQVASAIGHGWLDGISADLEAEGYACGAAVLGAHSVRSPHQRKRLYWVADSEQQGLEGQSRHGDNWSEPRRLNQDTAGSAPESGAVSGMVLANSDGCIAGSFAAAPAGHRNTIKPASFWTDSQLAHCRDGKTRRVPTEPAFFPLAHGVPARVVRLRGYGNAIVPQCAAEFIAAYCEAANSLHPVTD